MENSTSLECAPAVRVSDRIERLRANRPVRGFPLPGFVRGLRRCPRLRAAVLRLARPLRRREMSFLQMTELQSRLAPHPKPLCHWWAAWSLAPAGRRFARAEPL